MRDIPEPWPSPSDLRTLVAKSEGLFLWASTLVKFVEGGGLPHEKLQSALNIHTGLDSLYRQVFLAAPRQDPFKRVIGTIIMLQSPLSIEQLGFLLDLRTDLILECLTGFESILVIPEKHDQEIRPFHASLHDFLTNSERSQSIFVDPAIHHASILLNCLNIITTKGDTFGDEITRYACFNWCYHFDRALFYGTGRHLLCSQSKGLLMDAISKLMGDMFERWCAAVWHGSTRVDLTSAILQLEVSNILVLFYPMRIYRAFSCWKLAATVNAW